ncbi:hypothetical protein GF325_16400 [Candidatus Bathyarchaeota archaeon]|nr:hypothetical protein [Candidatus Bathyarchaeota archaeon]
MSRSNEVGEKRKQRLIRNPSFLIETIYLIIITIITLLVAFDYIDTGSFLGPLRVSHWFGIIGAAYMVFYTPFFYIFKRKSPNYYKLLMHFHVFGFTTAYLCISIHFAGQIGRPLQFYPDLGGGLALYIITSLLVATGYLHRYHPIKIMKGKGKYVPSHVNRVLHVSLLSGLFIILFIHALINSLP